MFSNCTTHFITFWQEFSEVTNVPMADLTFNKINSKGEGLSGASFKLVNDNDSSEVYTALHMVMTEQLNLTN